MELIRDFQEGRAQRVLISKAKILGFGLNLQIATRQVFSGLQDSYENYYSVREARSNRYGSTKPLNVHIPISDVEAPMVETVLKKAKRVQADTDVQEQLFKGAMCRWIISSCLKKTCGRCKKQKGVEEFYQRALRAKDGRQAFCKDCLTG